MALRTYRHFVHTDEELLFRDKSVHRLPLLGAFLDPNLELFSDSYAVMKYYTIHAV